VVIIASAIGNAATKIFKCLWVADVEHKRWLEWLVVKGARRCVDVGCGSIRRGARILVDVTEDVITRLDSGLDFLEKIVAAHTIPSFTKIPSTKRRPVSDQNVNVIRNHLPFVEETFISRKVEGPSKELWLPRASIH
jgi:hypothetical protein